MKFIRRLLLPFLAVASAAGVFAQQPPAPPVADKWEAEIAKIEAGEKTKPAPQGGIVFAGSSSIRLWKLKDAFPDLPVANRGFGGSCIADSTKYAERLILPLKPRVIVFYAGDNDLQNGLTPEKAEQDFRAFAGKIHAALPQTKILWLPIKPSIARWKIVEKQRDANKRVAAFCAAEPAWLRVVDLASPLLGEDGKPKAEYFVEDGLHLSPAGYAIWNKLVREALSAWGETEAARKP